MNNQVHSLRRAILFFLFSDPECYEFKRKQDMISSTTQTTTPPNLSSTTHSISLISDIMEEISNQTQHEKHDSDNGVTLVKLNAIKRFIVNCFRNSCLLY